MIEITRSLPPTRALPVWQQLRTVLSVLLTAVAALTSRSECSPIKGESC